MAIQRLFVLISLFVFSTGLPVSGAFGQTKQTGEIVAEGGSKVKVGPDIAVITLTVEKTDSIEKHAIQNLNIEIEALVKSLNKLGFSNSAIKISEYDISSNSYRDDGDKKKYTASNILKLEFRLDSKVINAIYEEIQFAALSDLEVSFNAKVSAELEKKTRIALVQQAIEDARNNANTISKSLQIKLLRIRRVSKYREDLISPDSEIKQVQFTPPKVVGDTKISYETPFEKFQVEDVELEEKVTIVYEVLNY